MSNTAPTDQANAIRWLLENSRSDVSFEEAIRQLYRALRGDTQAEAILHELAQSRDQGRH
ncbi:hypothetical protein DZC30_08065 [Comamonas testosteroni]|uniref:Uncharacterized protein n=1 Tax=Comamonas testosteroni TaxID=285 RepID=A0A373FPR3_COMTE|nr:hypothetical protein [Comamonas testosteroni]RGE45542.1 hypothetical protein DZC30_08065 [Comamonas testosteroni]